MAYVDGFVLPIRKDQLDQYKGVATRAGGVWMEYGALSYNEAVADDVPYGELTSFPRAVQCKDDEVVIFSWVTYRDRAHRDEVNAKVMTDPRLQPENLGMELDGKRMIFGGFTSLVAL